MVAFSYEAVGADGRVVSGELQAQDANDLLAQLSHRGLAAVSPPRRARVAARAVARARLKPADLADLASYVALTTRAGLSVVDSIADFAQDRPPAVAALLSGVVESVRGGTTLAEAFAPRLGPRDRAFLAMVRAGEESGALDEAMESAARQIRFQLEVRSRLRQALVQPAILLTCVGGLVLLLITFLLPRILGMLADANVPLPPTTAFLMAISGFLREQWLFVLIGGVAAGVGLRRFLRTERGQRTADRVALALPVVGSLVRLSAEARFVSTMGSLLGSGVDAVRSLRMAADASGSAVLGAQLQRAAAQVSEGSTLSRALIDGVPLHPLVRRMIQLGEATGSLQSTLATAVGFLSVELPRRVQRVVALLEPTIVVASGVVVAFILLSALMPVFSLYETY